LQLSPKTPSRGMDAFLNSLLYWIDAAGQLNSMLGGLNSHLHYLCTICAYRLSRWM
jgi:hypothetical protein